jgi:hypothetical protein
MSGKSYVTALTLNSQGQVGIFVKITVSLGTVSYSVGLLVAERVCILGRLPCI